MKWHHIVPVLFLAAFWGCGNGDKPADGGENPPVSEAQAPSAGNAPAQVSPPAAAADTQLAAAGPAGGEKVFKSTCAMCHQTGAAGAPVLGSKADWEARTAQGKEVLYKHALEGFTGEKGMMPAKGGNSSLSDADVKAAVDYMVSKAG